MNESFIAKRITELRLARNVSEYQMSLELGQSKSYIQSITAGRNLPSAAQLFNIASYFNMSLSEFFDENKHDSPVIQETLQVLRQMDDSDVELVLSLARRIARASVAEQLVMGSKPNSFSTTSRMYTKLKNIK